MRKFKILFLMLLGVFGLNSCTVLGTAAAVAYFGPQLLTYSCADSQGRGLCKILEAPEETPEQQAKKKEREEKRYEKNRKEYVQKLISQKRINLEILENVIISLPKDLEFRKETGDIKVSLGNILFRLYDVKKEEKIFYLYIVEQSENSKMNLEKMINNGRDENYEKYYKKISEEYIKEQIQEKEEKLNNEKENSQKDYYEKELKKYKEKLEKGFSIVTNVKKIGENIYIINEKINDFGDLEENITYVKILKDGVYIVAEEREKDIFEGLFIK